MVLDVVIVKVTPHRKFKVRILFLKGSIARKLELTCLWETGSCRQRDESRPTWNVKLRENWLISARALAGAEWCSVESLRGVRGADGSEFHRHSVQTYRRKVGETFQSNSPAFNTSRRCAWWWWLQHRASWSCILAAVSWKLICCWHFTLSYYVCMETAHIGHFIYERIVVGLILFCVIFRWNYQTCFVKIF